MNVGISGEILRIGREMEHNGTKLVALRLMRLHHVARSFVVKILERRGREEVFTITGDHEGTQTLNQGGFYYTRFLLCSHLSEPSPLAIGSYNKKHI